MADPKYIKENIDIVQQEAKQIQNKLFQAYLKVEQNDPEFYKQDPQDFAKAIAEELKGGKLESDKEIYTIFRNNHVNYAKLREEFLKEGKDFELSNFYGIANEARGIYAQSAAAPFAAGVNKDNIDDVISQFKLDSFGDKMDKTIDNVFEALATYASMSEKSFKNSAERLKLYNPNWEDKE